MLRPIGSKFYHLTRARERAQKSAAMDHLCEIADVMTHRVR